VKITGANHGSPVPAIPSSKTFLPDHCSSFAPAITLPFDITPAPFSPELSGECTENFPDEHEFDKFLLDAAEWL